MAPDEVVEVVKTMSQDINGRLLLANVLDSLDRGLVDRALVRDLFQDLADELRRDSTSRWQDAFARVCMGSVDTRRETGYVRSAPAFVGYGGPSQWATLVSGTTWYDRHLDSSKKRRVPLPRFPPKFDAEFERQFSAVTAEVGWFQLPTPDSGAWLGRPNAANANCWISCEGIGSSTHFERKDARRAAESLGIHPTSPFECYVRYSIDADPRSAVRPSFADVGSRWFRIHANTKVAESYFEHGWGATVDLSSVREGLPDDTGHPERVSRSIPLTSPRIKGLSVLFPSESTRPLTDAAAKRFDESVLRKRRKRKLQLEVLSIWAREAEDA